MYVRIYFILLDSVRLSVCSSVSQCTLFKKALRMALKEFLEDSKESRGVQGQASRQELRGHSV